MNLSFPISKKRHKYCELEFIASREFSSWFKIYLNWSRKTDHAGLRLSLELIWINLHFEIYDNRHWNYEKDRWYKYGEEAREKSDTDFEL